MAATAPPEISEDQRARVNANLVEVRSGQTTMATTSVFSSVDTCISLSLHMPGLTSSSKADYGGCADNSWLLGDLGVVLGRSRAKDEVKKAKKEINSHEHHYTAD